VRNLLFLATLILATSAYAKGAALKKTQKDLNLYCSPIPSSSCFDIDSAKCNYLAFNKKTDKVVRMQLGSMTKGSYLFLIETVDHKCLEIDVSRADCRSTGGECDAINRKRLLKH
jgi:hypothetical protein